MRRSLTEGQRQRQRHGNKENRRVANNEARGVRCGASAVQQVVSLDEGLEDQRSAGVWARSPDQRRQSIDGMDSIRLLTRGTCCSAAPARSRPLAGSCSAVGYLLQRYSPLSHPWI